MTTQKMLDNVLESIRSSAELETQFPREMKYRVVEQVKNTLKFHVVDGVIIVDCRNNVPEDFDSILKSHTGSTLWSSEAADYVLGFGKPDKFTTLVSVTGTGDLRPTGDSKFPEIVKNFEKYHDEFEKAARMFVPALNGGSVTYKPAFTCISNFGWSIHGFQDQKVITG